MQQRDIYNSWDHLLSLSDEWQSIIERVSKVGHIDTSRPPLLKVNPSAQVESVVVAHAKEPKAHIEIHRFPYGPPSDIWEAAHAVAYKMNYSGGPVVSVRDNFVVIMQPFEGKVEIETEFAGLGLYDTLQPQGYCTPSSEDTN